MIVSLLIALLNAHSVYCDGWKEVLHGTQIRDIDLETTSLEWKIKSDGSDAHISEMWFEDEKAYESGGFKIMLQQDKTVAYQIKGCQNENAKEKFTNKPTYELGKEMKWRITKVYSGQDDVSLKIHCDDKEVLNEKLAAPFCPAFDQAMWDKRVDRIEFLEPGNGVLIETGYRAYNAPAPKCLAGSYNDNGQCKKCDENTFSADGAESCTKCPMGEVSEAGSTSKDACKKYQAPSNGDSLKISAVLLSSLLTVCIV